MDEFNDSLSFLSILDGVRGEDSSKSHNPTLTTTHDETQAQHHGQISSCVNVPSIQIIDQADDHQQFRNPNNNNNQQIVHNNNHSTTTFGCVQQPSYAVSFVFLPIFIPVMPPFPPTTNQHRKQESSVHTSRGSKKIKKEATSSDDGDINRVDKRNTYLEWVLPSKEIPEGDIGVEIRVYISRKTQHQANATDGSKATPLCKYRFTVTEITQTEDHKIYVSQIFQKMENRMKFPDDKYIWIEIGKSTERIFVYCQGRGSGSKKAVSKPRTEQDTEKQENKITNQKKKTKNVVSIAVDGTVSLRKEILSAYSKHTSNAILTLDNELSTTSASSTSSSNEHLRQIN